METAGGVVGTLTDLLFTSKTVSGEWVQPSFTELDVFFFSWWYLCCLRTETGHLSMYTTYAGGW